MGRLPHPDRGAATRLFVSQTTGLILRREAEGEVFTFDDYRDVDGEKIAFRTTIKDALGDSSLVVDDVRFNVTFDDAVFAPNHH